ncbi:class I SAM-dependent methyltransferase [Sphingobium sp. CR28]|uniref:class I SAM-dependent methyltransferase n=1 Tax=Sphingobium sp. CR28 TaxID=3400272 RepID=UPI003FEF60BC
MAKEGERDYLAAIGEAGRHHAFNKPFSNHDCGLTLASIGAVMNLMPPLPARVLDLGCGSGWTSAFFARHGYDVVGQDIASDMIALAEEVKRHNHLGDNLNFVLSDYEGLDMPDSFDCAVFFDCLHHAEDEAAALRSVFTSLKPGGILITHEPGEGHSTTQASIEAMERYGVSERDMPPWLIIAHAEKAGFIEPRIFPMQHELLYLFYRSKPPRFFSRAGIRLARRTLKSLFGPNPRGSAIVVLRKPD